MGCNCKNKQKEPTKIITPEADLQEVKNIALETINQMEKILFGWNENTANRVVLRKFMLENFGEVIHDYCDIPCKKRVQKKLDKLKTEIK